MAGHNYNNCIRTEKGYCRIQYKESSTTSPDPFNFLQSIAQTTAVTKSPTCDYSYVYIPNLSPDGITQMPIPDSPEAFVSVHCGEFLGVEGKSVSLALVCKYNFLVELN